MAIEPREVYESKSVGFIVTTIPQSELFGLRIDTSGFRRIAPSNTGEFTDEMFYSVLERASSPLEALAQKARQAERDGSGTKFP